MQQTRKRKSAILPLVLVALSISLIVNFSQMLLLAVDEFGTWKPQNSEDIAKTINVRGSLSLNADGYGYLLCDEDSPIDSVFLSHWGIRNIKLEDGDILRVNAMPSHQRGARYRMSEIVEINGATFDYASAIAQQNKGLDLTLQIAFYFAMAILILLLLTRRVDRRNLTFGLFTRRSLWSLILVIGLYFIAPITNRYTGEITPVFATKGRWMVDYLVLLKCTFTLAVSFLYSYIYTLIFQRQNILLENEQLKSENLTTRYDMLVSQIKPHFFFNSLNSLSTLVRENDTQTALTYIDQLSYTFRYILQNSQNTEVPLKEELQSLEAYSYQFKIRYADKLFFDIDIDEEYLDYTMPPLALQPLIDNAVKHNSITSRHPMHISIRTEDGHLVVSNPKSPLVEPAPGTGIGLKNLDSRWELVTGENIVIIDTNESFTVKLPLQKPQN